MNRTPQPGRGWSTFGFAIGIGASIAANVAHSYVRPAHAATGWAPQPGAIVAAAFWPVALVISIEVISRVQWPHRWYWALIRYVGLSAVALIAAVISYGHLSALMRFYGEDSLSSTIGPLAVDGLMVVCSGALLAIGDNIRSHNLVEISTTTELVVSRVQDKLVSEIVDKVERKPRSTRRDSSATRVAKAAARNPGATPAQLAAKLGLSDATVRRYLKSDQASSGSSEWLPVPSSVDVVSTNGGHANGVDVLAEVNA